MTSSSPQPLSYLETADLYAGHLSVAGAALWGAVSGAFRGQSGAKDYKLHVAHAAIRKMVVRLTPKQIQSMLLPTSKAYEVFMKQKGLQPESVTLAHGASGHWIGNKNAKNVVIYYHGGGFVIPGSPGHFEFYSQVLSKLNSHGHDVAMLFLSYSLAPTATYPTQLRQSVSALDYIISETGRSPSSVIVGGDSAGGNLALSVFLHLAHPHPEIEPLGHKITTPLAGVFALAPWVDFSKDGPSGELNRYKDVIPPEIADLWAPAYLGGRTSDAWGEPKNAPLGWWGDAKDLTKQVLIVAGTDEVLFSAVDEFAHKLKTVVPHTTYVIGYDETHVAPVYSGQIIGVETQQGREFKRWLGARL